MPLPFPSRIAVRWAACVMMLALQACGVGDDGEARRAVTARDDRLVALPGQAVSPLGNDDLDGEPARAGAGGNVVLSLINAPAGITLGADGQSLQLAADLIPGGRVVGYRLCEAAAPQNCASATATVQVSVGALQAKDDEFTLWIGEVRNVLANDTQGSAGAAIVPGQFTEVTATGPLPAGVLLSPSGQVQLDARAAAGEHRFRYQACERGAPDNCSEASATVRLPAEGRIEGVAAAGMTVTAAGRAVTVSAVCSLSFCSFDGPFALRELPASDRLALAFDWGGVDPDMLGGLTLAPTGMVVALPPGQAVIVSPDLVSLGLSQRLEQTGPSPQTELALGSARLQWAAGAAVWPTGPAPAAVQAQLTVFDAPARPRSIPGDYTALAGGVPTPLELFGAVRVDLLDADAAGLPAALTLAAGQAATLRIPVRSRQAELPPTATLFRYDEPTGYWLAGATATLGGDAGGAWYEGTIPSLGNWAVARAIETVTLRGCVRDVDGRSVPGAVVSAHAVDLSRWAETASGTDGRFALQVPRGGRVELATRAAGAPVDSAPVDTRVVGPVAAETTLDDCLVSEGLPAIQLELFGCARYTGTTNCVENVLLAPTGESLLPRGAATAWTVAWQTVRPLVGTYRLLTSESAPGPYGVAAADRVATVTLTGRAPESFTLPEAASTVPGGGWWRVLEIEVDERCGVSLRRQIERVERLPEVVVAPGRYCRQ